MTDTTPGLELLHEGAAAHGRGEVAEALRIFEHAARTTTGGVRVSAAINAASMRDELGDHTGAVEGFRAALAEIPDDAVEKLASTLVNYSQALQHLGELDEAQRALERARDLLIGHEEFGTLRVSCLVSLTAVATHRGQWVRAIELATESLRAAEHFAPRLRGHPLGNLAVAHFESGRGELGLDFAQQALAAFEAAGDVNAAAEMRQNLAQMYARLGRDDEAEPAARESQRYFERAGLGYRAGVGLSLLGLLAERHGDLDRVEELYRRALGYFESSGAVLDAAGVRTRLATLAFAHGHAGDGEDLLAAAYQTYAERGLGLQCARVDFWHASLWESLIDDMAEPPPPEVLPRARDLAVTAAIAIDAVRYSFTNGAQRAQWNREMAAPALALAFRLAYRCGDGLLIADLIETQCAGTTLDRTPPAPAAPPQLPFEVVQPPASDPDRPPGTLRLGTALAQVAAAAGLPVSPPPRLTVPPDGRIALAAYIIAAEQRYGRPVREERVLPT
ncbi:tetratricopeptide repeat-containing protein [Nocardia nova SH22a]|uniref:Tetratricopeptide repeat-containing protein n=1 Tax=Nocardia nova SH22a TaxID=1415166 RepID=W5TMH6_9NOCA|nr:tetratricopeptide repeat protein [Nocardia nova]AHH20560.1 tetratricopeptide repeat-containing protein [Nocardia nova SH22a]